MSLKKLIKFHHHHRRGATRERRRGSFCFSTSSAATRRKVAPPTSLFVGTQHRSPCDSVERTPLTVSSLLRHPERQYQDKTFAASTAAKARIRLHFGGDIISLTVAACSPHLRPSQPPLLFLAWLCHPDITTQTPSTHLSSRRPLLFPSLLQTNSGEWTCHRIPI